MVRTAYKSLSDSELIGQIQKQVPDVSKVFKRKELELFYRACYGNYEIDFERDVQDKEIKVKSKPKNENRRKKRIDLSEDSKVASPVLKYLSKFPIVLKTYKTGLVVKYSHNNYEVNILNFQELRTVDDVLIGNLFLPLIKTEDLWESLDLDNSKTEYKGSAFVKRVTMDDLIEILSKEVIGKLIEIATLNTKHKKKNSKRFITKMS